MLLALLCAVVGGCSTHRVVRPGARGIVVAAVEHHKLQVQTGQMCTCVRQGSGQGQLGGHRIPAEAAAAQPMQLPSSPAAVVGKLASPSSPAATHRANGILGNLQAWAGGGRQEQVGVGSCVSRRADHAHLCSMQASPFCRLPLKRMPHTHIDSPFTEPLDSAAN